MQCNGYVGNKFNMGVGDLQYKQSVVCQHIFFFFFFLFQRNKFTVQILEEVHKYVAKMQNSLFELNIKTDGSPDNSSS